jgi:hypothetical protein
MNFSIIQHLNQHNIISQQKFTTKLLCYIKLIYGTYLYMCESKIEHIFSETLRWSFAEFQKILRSRFTHLYIDSISKSLFQRVKIPCFNKFL